MATQNLKQFCAEQERSLLSNSISLVINSIYFLSNSISLLTKSDEDKKRGPTYSSALHYTMLCGISQYTKKFSSFWRYVNSTKCKSWLNETIHCKNRLAARESWVSDIPAEDGKIARLFLQCNSKLGLTALRAEPSPPASESRRTSICYTERRKIKERCADWEMDPGRRKRKKAKYFHPHLVRIFLQI